MADLTEAMLTRLLAHEGGLVDDPDDPGGVTNHGISKRSYPGLDIRRLTPADAKVIYRRDFFEKPGLEAIPDPGLLEQVFDLGVNGGLGRAFRLLHRSFGLPEAPFWTPALRAALAAEQDWPAKRATFLAARIAFYERLAAQRPTSRKFLKGWLRRARAVAAVASATAG